MNDVQHNKNVKDTKKDRPILTDEFLSDVRKAYDLINGCSVQTKEMVEASTILRKHLEPHG